MIGSTGNDRITASTGLNVLTGGLGNDAFVFISTGAAGSGATRYQIQDFAPRDTIDVSAIDANGTQGGDPPFTFVGQITNVAAGFGQFCARAQIGYHYETDASGVEHTIVEGNINAGLAADFQIDLIGRIILTSSTFVL